MRKPAALRKGVSRRLCAACRQMVTDGRMVNGRWVCAGCAKKAVAA